MDKKVILIAIICSLLLIGCGKEKVNNEETLSASYTGFTVETMSTDTWWSPSYILTDEETGNQYIIVEGRQGIAITPRYDISSGQIKKVR